MRPTNFIGVATCAFSIFIAIFFLENYLLLIPCPLCILDRIVLVAMGIVFFIGFFVKKFKMRMILSFTNIFFLAFGFLFSIRHVWLQNIPLEEMRNCLSEEKHIAGITDFIKEAFSADADCSLIGWQLFGLSIPALTLLLFIFLLGVVGFQIYGNYYDKDENSID